MEMPHYVICHGQLRAHYRIMGQICVNNSDKTHVIAIKFNRKDFLSCTCARILCQPQIVMSYDFIGNPMHAMAV